MLLTREIKEAVGNSLRFKHFLHAFPYMMRHIDRQHLYNLLNTERKVQIIYA